MLLSAEQIHARRRRREQERDARKTNDSEELYKLAQEVTIRTLEKHIVSADLSKRITAEDLATRVNLQSI